MIWRMIPVMNTGSTEKSAVNRKISHLRAGVVEGALRQRPLNHYTTPPDTLHVLPIAAAVAASYLAEAPICHETFPRLH
jgi:hypothetical protein